MEKIPERDVQMIRAAPSAANINWCSGANEWDDDDEWGEEYDDTQHNEPVDEQNGNIVCNNVICINNKNDNSNSMSEDDDESNSMESDPIPSFGNLQVVDDKNANCGDQGEWGT